MGYVGQVLLNYELTKKLGEGGFGVVYLAEHTELPRKAAVKILHPHYSRDRSLVERFIREAKAACAIGHEAIIDVQNFGRLDSGEPYFLMEFFPGQSLEEWLAEHGSIPLHRLSEIFEPVVDALEAAHAADVIHRDLKPDNIMIRERDGRFDKVKLLDFGIAKLIDNSADVQSQTGLAMGTPMFMAPEQSRDSKNVDTRADVYSLGATLFKAIAGRPPFVANNLTDLIVQIQTQSAPALSLYVPDVSPVLDGAIAACLAKTPEDRPGTIRLAWEQIVAGLQARPDTHAPSAPATRDSVRIAPSGAGMQTTLSGGASEVRRVTGPTRRWAWVSAGAITLAAGIVAVIVSQSGDSNPSPPAAAASPMDSSVAATPVIEPKPQPTGEPLVDAGNATPKPVPPETARQCSKRSFSPSKTRAAIRRQLKRLKACRRENELTGRQTTRLEATLERALAKLAASDKPVKPTKEDPPELDCTKASFAAIYKKASPTEREINGALRRLRKCKPSMPESLHRKIQTALVASQL